MKKSFFLYLVIPMLVCACSSSLEKEYTVKKQDVEFAGNVFHYFSLGDDVKLYPVKNPGNEKEWTVQAVVPMSKVSDTPLEELTIDIIPSDEEGARLRDGFALQGENLANLVSAGEHVERIIKFAIQDQEAKYMSSGELAQLLNGMKKLRMVLIAKTSAESSSAKATAAPASAKPSAEMSSAPARTVEKTPEKPVQPKTPMTLEGLFKKYGVYGLLSQYEQALSNGNKSGAKQIEDRLWEIEKSVRGNNAIPKDVRDRFVRYIEDKEDEIEDRY